MSTKKYIIGIEVKFDDGSIEHVSAPSNCKRMKIIFETHIVPD